MLAATFSSLKPHKVAMLQIFLLLGCLTLGEGYKAGAPLSQCEGMTPNHGYAAQTTTPPYNITVSSATYTGEDKIIVTLTATRPDTLFFEGFLIMARRADCSSPGIPFGRFSFMQHDPEMKTMTCPSGKFVDNAVTHTNSAHKVSKSFLWSNPDGEDVYFQYTLVNHKDTFWTNIKSGTVYDVSKPTGAYTSCAGVGHIAVVHADTSMYTTPAVTKRTYTDQYGEHFPRSNGASRQIFASTGLLFVILSALSLY